VAHENQIPDVCDDLRLIQPKCVENLLRPNITDSSRDIKQMGDILVPDQEPYFLARGKKRSQDTALRSMWKARRAGCKLLVLRLGKQGLMDFGVVDHFGQQPLTERS
jgi:hypothetical protein